MRNVHQKYRSKNRRTHAVSTKGKALTSFIAMDNRDLLVGRYVLHQLTHLSGIKCLYFRALFVFAAQRCHFYFWTTLKWERSRWTMQKDDVDIYLMELITNNGHVCVRIFVGCIIFGEWIFQINWNVNVASKSITENLYKIKSMALARVCVCARVAVWKGLLSVV